jgi:hypothetical protein
MSMTEALFATRKNQRRKRRKKEKEKKGQRIHPPSNLQTLGYRKHQRSMTRRNNRRPNNHIQTKTYTSEKHHPFVPSLTGYPDSAS